MKNNAAKIFCGTFLVFGLLCSGCAKLNPKFEDSLNNAVMAKTSEFEKCYQKELHKKPETAGNMQLKLEFAPKSKSVEKASVVKSQIKSNGMKKCVTDAARTIETAELPGTWVDGKYTLDFRAAE